MTAEEIMTKKPEYVAPSDTVRDSIEKMLELEIRHLPVVEDGELVGILSDRDIRSWVLPLGTSVDDLKAREKQLERQVKEIMHTDVISVEPGTDIPEIIELMLENKISAVPVVDGQSGWLKGIISYVDLLKVAKPLFEEN